MPKWQGTLFWSEMHHALEIEEILVDIFAYCYPLPDLEKHGPSTLAALARTCHAFKEPALDALWVQLNDLTSLVRCIPGASYRYQSPRGENCYSFHRSLTQLDWDLLRGYTCRIRSVVLVNHDRLGRKSIKALSRSPTDDTLFPNLRSLHLDYPRKAINLFVRPIPSLVSLSVSLSVTLLSPHSFQNSVNVFAKVHPNVTKLSIGAYYYASMDWKNINPNFVCRWRNLQRVDCLGISLDAHALVHLSQMRLTKLAFSVNNILSRHIPPSSSPLIFSNLHDLLLRSQSLDSCSHLLSHARLPATVKFSVYVISCPSRQDLSFFFASIQTCGIGRTVENLTLVQDYIPSRTMEARPTLGLEDLQTCMSFSNLRETRLDIQWEVAMMHSELLALALAWPSLEALWINKQWSWNTSGGITPDGLLQLVRTCPSLHKIAFRMDTRGYLECHVSPANLGIIVPPEFCIDLLDSSIEEASVPAIADFLATIVSPPPRSFLAWEDGSGEFLPHRDVCRERWKDVRQRAEYAIQQRS